MQTAASAIVVGLPFVCQLQTFYLDPPDQTTTQGKRANIQAVTVRLEQSRGIQIGSNQPDLQFFSAKQRSIALGEYDIGERAKMLL